jgi:hypothetical protein
MQEDAAAVHDGRMEWEQFVETYGHLRPGSYDITSPCYASAAKEFLRPMIKPAPDKKVDTAHYPWSEETRAAIGQELKRIGLEIDVNRFERFLRQSIEGREFGKFIFMRNINAALEALAEFGSKNDLSRQDLSHVRIKDLLALRSASTVDQKAHLEHLIQEGREQFATTQAVYLPSIITSESDLVCFEQFKAEPNFVTRKKVRAEVASLSGPISPDIDLTGKIAVLPNADPGFDWLFSRDICGLVTMYGGVNSHMTIRAAEFQLPAAIGIGELLFETMSQAELIELDCASRQIKVIR